MASVQEELDQAQGMIADRKSSLRSLCKSRVYPKPYFNCSGLDFVGFRMCISGLGLRVWELLRSSRSGVAVGCGDVQCLGCGSVAHSLR